MPLDKIEVDIYGDYHCPKCDSVCEVHRLKADHEQFVAICKGCGGAFGRGREARDLLAQYAKDNGIKPEYDRLGDPN